MSLDFKVNSELLELDNKPPLDNVTTEEAKSLLHRAIGKDTTFLGFCMKALKDGSLELDYNGVKCVLNIDDFTVSTATVRRHWAQTKVGTYINFRVKEYKDNCFIVERKSIVSEIKSTFSKLQAGHNIYGVVTRIEESKGVFVYVGGDTFGLIPKPYLESIFIKNLSDHVSIGEKVYVKVSEIQRTPDGDIESLILNRKVLLQSFEELTKDIEPYEVHLAKVKFVTDKGIHCSLTPHLDIYCDFVHGLRVKADDMVRVKITRIRQDKQRINGDIIGVI